MISLKKALIDSIYLRFAWIMLIFCLIIVLHVVKTIYSPQGVIFWGYTTLTVTVFFLNVYCFQKCASKKWIYVLILGSCVIGFIPYETHIPVTYDLITNPNIKLYGLSSKLPFGIGRFVEALFFPVLTFILLLGSSLKINKQGR